MSDLAAELAESIRVDIHRQLAEACWCNDWPRYQLTEEGERVADDYDKETLELIK